MKCCSLFSGAGIGETYLRNLGIKVAVANELIESRAHLYEFLYKDTEMVQGDVLDSKVFRRILNISGSKVDLLIATPPCQGMSIAGKNRKTIEFSKDERNYLIYKVVEFVKKKKPNFILIENVPLFLNLHLPHNGNLCNIKDLLFKEFNGEYNIEVEILDSSNFGVPQKRKRAIIKLYKKGLYWGWPANERSVTVRDAIGHLPSLESGEKSKIPWHFARRHIDKHILWMKHTPTGKTAYENKQYYPQKEDGSRIKGYESCYRRIKWDEPAPTITIRNDAISSQRNVHPGRRLKDGTYSDARVLTPLEIMILSSLPKDWPIPMETPEILIRQCIGESVPPLMVKKIVKCIGQK